jgi:hypothetical protein
MKKIYAVMWNFYSSFESSEIDSLWTTEDNAYVRLHEIINRKGLVQEVRKGTAIDAWSDGDYYLYIATMPIDDGNNDE